LTTLHGENSALDHANKAMIDNEHVDGDGCGRSRSGNTVRLVGKRSIAHEKRPFAQLRKWKLEALSVMVNGDIRANLLFSFWSFTKNFGI